jgi:prevent-host-death family protein
VKPFSWLAKVAIGSYFFDMTTVSIKQAKDQLTALARRVEQGETVVVTRNGKPVFDLVPHREKKRGLDIEAAHERLRRRGIVQRKPYIPVDFDDPLPEDFLLKPLPER